MTNVLARMLDRELKKGSAELLILSLLEARPRHGYEISKLIEDRSRGASVSTSPPSTRFSTGSRSAAGSRAGGWRRPGTRRRRFYRLTREGRKVLATQRDNWLDFVEAVARITGVETCLSGTARSAGAWPG